MERRAAFGKGPVLAAAFLCAVWTRGGVAFGQEDGAKPAQEEMGQLKIVGEHVETIVLVDGKGRKLPFSGADMGNPLELAIGSYKVQEIRLEGGYQCMIWSDFGQVYVRRPGETVELKVGAPLTQSITVAREGKMFRLRYELKGVGGEAYTMTDHPPGFAVYKGDRKVGGGTFEFG